MSAFVLKIIACISMFMDHIGYIIFNGTSYFNYIGRFAFPIFAFQISQGYIHTKDVKKYFKRLLIFAIISQIPFMLFRSQITSGFAINTIFTLLFGLAAIYSYDKISKVFGVSIALSLGLIAEILKFDYGFYGVIIILLFYMFRKNTILLVSSFSLVTIIKYSFMLLPFISYGSDTMLMVIKIYLPLCVFTILSSLFICLYNGKKGHDSKYLLYWFYPVHLLAIYIFTLF